MTLVLIVDDVPAMAEQYAYDLKRLRGYETLIAQSGRTALESLTRDSVDCVILDLEMPGMDGFEVLRSVERLGLRVPVIVYTGTGDYDRCAQAIRLGAYSFIDKAESMERGAEGGVRSRQRRHAVSGRDRRSAARRPGQAPARARGAQSHPRRREQDDRCRHARRRSDPSRSREGSGGGTVPRGPVLSAERACAARAAAARSSLRRPRAGRAPGRRDLRALRREAEDRRAGCGRGADVVRLAAQQHSRAPQCR